MKRIGTTDEGGALIELAADEVATIQAALPILSQFGAEVPQRIPPPALAARKLLAKVDPPGLVAAREIARQLANPPHRAEAEPAEYRKCKVCTAPKGRDDFPKSGGRVCKACTNEAARAKYKPVTPRAQVAKVKQSAAARFAPKHHKLSGRVTRDTAPAVRERDPQLDRPVTHGRVEQVGAQE